MSADLVARQRAQRERWAETKQGRRMLVRRPGVLVLQETLQRLRGAAVAELLRGSPERGFDDAIVVGWEGYTENDLLGPAGGSTPIPFDPAIFYEYVIDRGAAELGPLLDTFLALVADFNAERDSAGKNSASSSTIKPASRKGTKARSRRS